MKLLYIDLFCGAGGTSTGVETAKYEGDKCAKVICEALVKKLHEIELNKIAI